MAATAAAPQILFCLLISIVYVVWIGMAASPKLVDDDFCNQRANNNCMGIHPLTREVPTCDSQESPPLRCTRLLNREVLRCSEEVKRMVQGRAEAIKRIEETFCADEEFQKEFTEAYQCWNSVSSCINGFITGAMSYEERDPDSEECRNSRNGFDICRDQVKKTCTYISQVSRKFYDQLEVDVQCIGCRNSAFSLTFITFFVALAILAK